MGKFCNHGKADYSDMIVHYARAVSVINDAQTNRVCALSITHISAWIQLSIVEYSDVNSE